jgi:small GTP-binding protein
MMKAINEVVGNGRPRGSLKETLDQMPAELKGWKALIDRALEHLHWVTGTKRSIAIIGPANAGKSTLFNALIRSKSDRAAVGATPGTTREIQEADAGIFEIVDTPGTDAIGDLGEQEREKALQAAREADLIIVLFDASHGIRDAERQLFDQLLAEGKPMVVALNKIDLVGRERNQVVHASATALGRDCRCAGGVAAGIPMEAYPSRHRPRGRRICCGGVHTTPFPGFLPPAGNSRKHGACYCSHLRI